MRWLLLFLAIMPAWAGETFVVCAGVERYDDQRITPLKYAVADARAVAAAFRASGVPRGNVTLLTTDGRKPEDKPTRINLITALQSVRDHAQAGDRLIFFFAGHGVEQDGRQYMLSSDTIRDLMTDTSVPMTLVQQSLSGLAADEVLFIVDACRNDPQSTRGDVDARLTDGLARGLRPALGNRPTEPKVAATLLSCDVGERAYEDPDSGHGAFTSFLLKGLSGGARQGDGPVRLSDLAAYVRREVATWAAKAGRLQHPRLLNPGGADMDLLTPPAEPVVSVLFRNTALTDAVAELAAEYGAQVVLGPGVDPDARVNGRLDLQPLSTALRVLLLAHGLTVRRDGAIYVICRPSVPQPAGPAGAADDQSGVAPTGPEPDGWPEYIAWPPVRDPELRFRVRPTDGMPQVLVPAGDFAMGSPEDEPGRETDEGPQRRVHLSAFWMDLHEVTVEQYRRYCAATGHAMAEPSPFGWEDRHPVANVTWDDAVSYCRWVGRRIPTEAQWEKAARGGTTGAFPWGAEWDTNRANAVDSEPFRVALVASYPPNGYGLFDLTGNVWEWCQDWYDERWYTTMPDRDPVCRAKSTTKVSRGGAWPSNPDVLRAASRRGIEPGKHGFLTGFRCSEPAVPSTPATAQSTSAGTTSNGQTGWPDYLRLYPAVRGMQYRIWEKDGMPQVLIPAGEFTMGSSVGEQKLSYEYEKRLVGDEADDGHDEGPQRRIYVSAFWMDLHEVTNQQYCQFLNSWRPDGRELDRWVALKGAEPSPEWATRRQGSQITLRDDIYVPETGKEHHPVAWLSWEGASAYAAWAGRQLPTEAQWEKAARGGTTTMYPWGPNWDQTRANGGNGPKRSMPVGSYPPNGFGLLDMIGNLWEYCRDVYDEGWYARMPHRDPVNTGPGTQHSCRGGFWRNPPTNLRAAYRFGTQSWPQGAIGFRCVSPAEG